jgi:predicted DNA-binding transcriptional regulator YafY
MNRTERFYIIEELLRQRKAVSFASLQAELEVSRSTLKRDLDYLRTRMHAPIEWDRVTGNYRMAEAGPHSGRPHQLPGLWFSSAEIHALLTMQHLLSNLDAGGVLTPHVAPLMARLNTLLEDGADHDADQLRRRVRIIGLAQRAVQPTHFQRVGSALVQRKRLALSYLARGSGQATEREVLPLRLVHYRGNWYLDAWCHLRNGLRNFALDAMRGAHLLDTTAKEVPDAKLHAIFAPSYGLFSGSRIRWARLLFTPERARWVAYEQWHPEQKGEWQGDGSYLLRIPYADHRELIMDILKHGEHCEVLGPPSLRKQVVEQLTAMAGKYLLG